MPRSVANTPKLYDALASWWPLLSAPAEYEQEAALYVQLLKETSATHPSQVLELGCGGGNNGFHMKAHFSLVLTDMAPKMLALSEALNPECEHVLGDMRTLRLDRLFDAVFVHDAISYMTTEQDLAAALETVARHLKPGGAFLIAADDVTETFQASTSHGGHDSDGRSLRYLMWTHQPDPASTTCVVDFAYLLKEGEEVRAEHDRHAFGLFPRQMWLESLARAGLEGRNISHVFSDGDSNEMFVGTKRYSPEV